MKKINARNSPLFEKGLQKWTEFVQAYVGPYDFSNSTYAGMNQKVTYICPVHGQVQSDAKNLMQGRQCQKCMFVARKGRNRITQNKMLARFKEVHGGIYDYRLAEYSGQRQMVDIICPWHGVFSQVAEYHWNGAGCPQCCNEYKKGASQRLTQKEFEDKVDAVHGGLVSVAGVVYVNSQSDIIVSCTKHGGELKTRANWLIGGANPCPKCNHMKSKGEQAVARFLKTFTSVEERNRTILKPKELDIYLPDYQLAVEYCGMYWHSFGDAIDEKKGKHNHANKYAACREKGVRLITLYETDWLERGFQVKRLLRSAIGKLKGRVLARKCQLKMVPPFEARVFFEKYHIQGGAGSGEHYGLYWADKLVACMRFTFGGNDRGSNRQRQWTLSRYATRINVVGGASRLFTAFLRDHNPATVKSFSDNRCFEGAMYDKIGFVLQEEIAPDYQVWSPKLGLSPKSHYQRRLLQKRLDEHGMEEVFYEKTDPRTEAQMTYFMGARRIYDCGKRRWLWKAVDVLPTT